MATIQTMLEAAFEYHALGWSVLALCPPDHVGMTHHHKQICTSPGKCPWHEWKDRKDEPATTDMIREWWRKRPTSNVGMAYGSASGLVGIDIDGETGEKELAVMSGGDLPPTLEFTTPGGGRRLLYAVGANTPLRTTAFKTGGNHCEIRLQAAGAQTVMPPSAHAKGGVYAWAEGFGPRDIDPAPAPAWLLAALAPPPPKPRTPVRLPPIAGNRADPAFRAAAYLDNVPEAVSGEGGHDRTMWAARVVVWGFDLGPDVGYQLLAERYDPRCRPGWSERELRHKCQQADTVPFDQPRGWLLDTPPKQAKVAAAAKAEGGEPAAEEEKDRSSEWTLSGDDGVIAEGHDIDMPDGVQGGGKGPRVFAVESMGRLLEREFPAPRYAVHGLLSEGLNLLAGPPKLGKSMLALNLALTVAGGGRALGDRDVHAGDVLYLSLEDQARRVKDRATKMLKGLVGVAREEAAKRLFVVTSWARQDRGGLAMIDAWVRSRQQASLVIIDVWNRFSPQANGRTSAYDHDADAMSLVKELADLRGFTALIIHHTRKGAPGLGKPEDFVAEISGTIGLSGTADGLLALSRVRGNNEAHLQHTGRDGEEGDLVVEFDPINLVWKSLGTAKEHVTGKVQIAVIAYLKLRGIFGATAPEVADATGQEPDSVRRALNRMLGERIVSKKGNLWRWPVEEGDAESGPERSVF